MRSRRFSRCIALFILCSMLMSALPAFAQQGGQPDHPSQAGRSAHARRAVEKIVRDKGIPSARLKVVLDEPRGSLLPGRRFQGVTLWDEATGKSFKLMVDQQSGQVSDVWDIDKEERRAHFAKYGKFAPSVFERLAGMQDDDTLTVIIWAVDQAGKSTSDHERESRQRLAAKYPAVKQALERGKKPMDLENPQLAQQVKLEYSALLDEAAKEQVRPLARFMQAQGIAFQEQVGIPLVYATLSKKQLQVLKNRPEVGMIDLAELDVGPALETSPDVIGASAVRQGAPGYDGTGVHVAVLEYGNVDMDDFTNAYSPPGVCEEGTNNCFAHPGDTQYGLGHGVLQPFAGDAVPLDDWHATLVGSIIASNHSDYTGVAPGATIHSAGVEDFDTDAELHQKHMEALHWAFTRASVTNASIGTQCDPDHLDNTDLSLPAITKMWDYYARTRSMMIVAAAGNTLLGCPEIKQISGFARGWNVLAVGAFNDHNTLSWGDDTMAEFSQWVNPNQDRTDREKPELVAPGEAIEGVVVDGRIAHSGNPNTTLGSGTSFAAPHVSGVAALMIDRNQPLALTPEAMRAILMASAVNNISTTQDWSPPNIVSWKDLKDGAGGIDAELAVATAGFQMSTTFEGTVTPSACLSSCWWLDEVVTLKSNEDYEFNSADYRDYKFMGTAEDEVRIALSWWSTVACNEASWTCSDYLGTDFDIALVDPNGKILAKSESSRNNYELIAATSEPRSGVRLPVTGEYRIRVYDYSSTEYSNYLGLALTKVVEGGGGSLGTDPSFHTPLDPSTYPANYNFSSGLTNLNVAITPASYTFEGVTPATSDAFAVPAGAQSLRFNYQTADIRDGNSNAVFYVDVLSGATFGTVTRIDAGTTNGAANDGWKQAVLDLQAFAGQTVKLRFSNSNAYGKSSVDSLSVNVEVPGWTPSNATAAQVLSDLFNHPGSGSHLQLTGANNVTSVSFAVPAAAQSLRFDYWTSDIRDGNSAGAAYVDVLSGATFGTVTRIDADLVNGSANDGWKRAALNLQAYQGQTVKLRLRNWSAYGKTLFDNISLNIETPGWTPSSVPAVRIVDDNVSLSAGVAQPANSTFEQAGSAFGACPANCQLSSGSSDLGTVITPASYTVDGSTPLTSDSFKVPADTQSLRFSYQAADIRDGNNVAAIYVYVLSGPAFATVTRIDASTVEGAATDGLKQAVLDLQRFQGQTVKLRFANWAWPGKSQVQDLSLNVEVPGWSMSQAASVQVVDDGNNHPGSGAHLLLNGANTATTGEFTVPAGAQSLRFDYWTADVRDGASSAVVYVDVLSGPSLSIETRISANTVEGAATNGWKQAVLDLQRFAGEPIRLRFSNWSAYGKTRLDNLAVAEVLPGWTPSSIQSVQPASQGIPGDPGVSTVPNGGFGLANEPLSGCPTNCAFAQGRETLATGITPASYTLSGTTPATSDALSVPATAQGLRFSYLASDTRDPAAAAAVYVYVLSGPDFATSTRIDADLAVGSLNGGWKQAVLDLQRFQGQTVKLRFANWAWPGSSQLTSLSLTVEAPGWSMSNTPSVELVDDGNNYPGGGGHLLLSGPNSATSSQVVVPADAQSLRFNYWTSDTRDPAAAAAVYVYVLSGPGFATTTRIDADLATGSLNAGWKQATLNLQRFAGQTVKLRFANWAWPGKTRLDNLGFWRDIPSWTPANIPAAQAVDDGNNYPGSGGHLLFAGAHTTISAAFKVPVDTQSLQFNYWTSDIRSATGPASVYVYVLSGPDFTTVTRIDGNTLTGTLNDGWKQATLNLQRFRGQTVKLRFMNWSAYGKTRLDNLSLLGGGTSLDTTTSMAMTGAYLTVSGAATAESSAFDVATDAGNLTMSYWTGDVRDGNSAGSLYVDVLSGPDFTTVTRIDGNTLTGALNDGWKQATLNVQRFRGQPIKLRFSNWSAFGKSMIDTLALTTAGGGLAVVDMTKPALTYYDLKGATSLTSDAFAVSSANNAPAFWYQLGDVRSGNGTMAFYVEVLSGATFSTVTRIDGNAFTSALNDGWKRGVLSLSAYQGQTIKLRFRNSTAYSHTRLHYGEATLP